MPTIMHVFVKVTNYAAWIKYAAYCIDQSDEYASHRFVNPAVPGEDDCVRVHVRKL